MSKDNSHFTRGVDLFYPLSRGVDLPAIINSK
jgi:hypothetical protein